MKITFKKLYAFKLFSMIALLGGCASHSNNLPSWYANPPAMSSDTLYGVGLGISTEDAKSNAINDMASKIKVEVSSRTASDTTYSSVSGAHQSTERNIVVKIAPIDFGAVEVSKTEIKNGQTAILVTTSKSSIINAKIKQIKDKESNISSLKQNLSNKNSIPQQYKTLLKINDINAQMLPLIITIETLDGHNIVAKNSRAAIVAFNNNFVNATNVLTVKINCSNTDLKNVLNEEINKMSIKTLSSSLKENSNTLIINASVSFTTKVLNGTHMAKGRFNFSFKDANGHKLAEKNHTVSSSSIISGEEAEKSTIMALQSQLGEKNIFAFSDF